MNMIMRRKFSPLMATELTPIATTPGRAIDWQAFVSHFDRLLSMQTYLRDLVSFGAAKKTVCLKVESQPNFSDALLATSDKLSAPETALDDVALPIELSSTGAFVPPRCVK